MCYLIGIIGETRNRAGRGPFMYKHRALIIAILAVMSHAKLLADSAAKPTDLQIAHIA
jgi:hypothetical protein